MKTNPNPNTPLANMKIIALLLALTTVVASAQDVTQTPLKAGHPLIGTWHIDLPNECFEDYTLRADGTKSSESAEERNESVFQMSEQSPDGFYKWTDKIVKTNGKPDCGGVITELGHVAVNYIRLHQTGTRFLLCESETMESCFAEFHRKDIGA